MTRSILNSCCGLVTLVAMTSTALAQQQPQPQPQQQPPPWAGVPPPAGVPAQPGDPAAQPAAPPAAPPPYPAPPYPPPGTMYDPVYGAPGPGAAPAASAYPNGYHYEYRMRTGLVIAGGVMLGVSYLISASVAAASVAGNDDELAPLFIPVAGPFITIGTADVFDIQSDLGGLFQVLGGMVLVLDGLVQIAGVTLLVVGLAAEKEVKVPNTAQAPIVLDDIVVSPQGAALRFRF